MNLDTLCGSQGWMSKEQDFLHFRSLILDSCLCAELSAAAAASFQRAGLAASTYFRNPLLPQIMAEYFLVHAFQFDCCIQVLPTVNVVFYSLSLILLKLLFHTLTGCTQSPRSSVLSQDHFFHLKQTFKDFFPPLMNNNYLFPFDCFAF